MAIRLKAPANLDLRPISVLRCLRRWPAVSVILLLCIWVALPLVPEETGLRFGLGYRMFFTVLLVLGTIVFWLLSVESIPLPKRPGGIMLSIVGVYLCTVGALMLVGVLYPQFQRPTPAGAAAQGPAELGEALFWNETGKAACFRCHSMEGRGGTRGPELTKVASRAGDRVPGLTAEQYLMEKVSAGMTYTFTVPEYTPMMPPFGQILSPEEINNLVAYLLSLGQD